MTHNTREVENRGAGTLRVSDFHCSNHGYINPKPHCPKCYKEQQTIHHQLQKAREEQNKHIGNQLLAYYENNVDPKGELKDKWFVKLVKNLADILVKSKDHSELDQPNQ